jgi:hypothetical protein
MLIQHILAVWFHQFGLKTNRRIESVELDQGALARTTSSGSMTIFLQSSEHPLI